MSDQVDELKEIEKKKLDAAYDTYNGDFKAEEIEAAESPEQARCRPLSHGSGNANLGILLITAGILLFLIFSGVIPRLGVLGWLLAGWLMISIMKGKLL